MYHNTQFNPCIGYPQFGYQQAEFQRMGSNTANQQWMERNDVNHNSPSRHLMMQQQAMHYQTSIEYGTTGRYKPGCDYYNLSSQHKQTEPYNTTKNVYLDRYAPPNLGRTVTNVHSRIQNQRTEASGYNNLNTLDSRNLQNQFYKVDPKNVQNQGKEASVYNKQRSNPQVQPIIRAVQEVKPLKQIERCKNTVNDNSYTENNWLIPPYASGIPAVDAVVREGDKQTHNLTGHPLIQPIDESGQRYYNTNTINNATNNSTVATQYASSINNIQGSLIQGNQFKQAMNQIFDQNHVQQCFNVTTVTQKRKADNTETGYKAKHVRGNGENEKYKCIDQTSQTDETKTGENNINLNKEAKFMSNAMELINQMRFQVNVMSEKINYFQRALQSSFDDMFRKPSYGTMEHHTKQTNETHTTSTAHTEQANEETTQYFHENLEPQGPEISNIEVNNEQHTTEDSYEMNQKVNRANNEVPSFVQVKEESTSSFSDEILGMGQSDQMNNEETEITIKEEIKFKHENSLQEENRESANYDSELQIKEEKTDGTIEDSIFQRFSEPFLNSSLDVKQETSSQNEIQQSMREFSQGIDSFINQEIPIEELRMFVENNVKIASDSETSNVENKSTITQRTRPSNTEGSFTSNEASMDELRRCMETDVRVTATTSNSEQSNIQSKLSLTQSTGQPRTETNFTNTESDKASSTTNAPRESTQKIIKTQENKEVSPINNNDKYKSSLRHPEFKNGLVELTEGSGIYVVEAYLIYCLNAYKSQGMLAASLLFLIFSEECLKDRKLIKDAVTNFGSKLIFEYVERKAHLYEGPFSRMKCISKMRNVLKLFHVRFVNAVEKNKRNLDGKLMKRSNNGLKRLFKKLKLKTNTC